MDNIVESIVRGTGELNDFDNFNYNNSIDGTIELVVLGAVEILTRSVIDNDQDLIGKEKSTVWMKDPYIHLNGHSRAVNIVKHPPDLINQAKHAKTPLECFNLMILG